MDADNRPLRHALSACRSLIAYAVLFSIGVNLLYLAPSLFMMQVYDRVLLTGNLTTLMLIGAVLAVALLVLALLDALRSRILVRMSLRLERLVTPALVLASLNAQRPQNKGSAQQTLREFDTLRQAITGPGAVALMDAPWAPIYVLVCFLIHPLIALVAIIGAIILLVLAIANDRAISGTIVRAGELAPRLYAAQEAEAASAEVVRALGMRSALVDRQMARRAQVSALQTVTSLVTGKYGGATKFVRLALQSAALGLGAWLAIERQISPGALIAASILTARALAPLEQIIAAWRQLGQARLSYRVVESALADGETRTHTTLPRPRGTLRVERIGMRAPTGDRVLLSDISFAVEPGDILGIVGPSGAGKSTLARVIAGAVIADAGVVRLDAANIADWDPDRLGRHVGYLPQNVQLLAGTIAENISRFAVRGRADELIDAATIAAARAAGAHDLILRQLGGYDRTLGIGGEGLSFGQAQRVGLARALYGDPSLIVLDEPNAHLDAEGEAALITAVKDAKARGAAIVIVAHRAGALALADRLLVLRDGRLDMIGARDEVLARLNANSGAASAAQRVQA